MPFIDPPPSGRPGSQVGRVIPYLPAPDELIPTTMDIYSGSAGAPPPGAGARQSAVPCLIAGVGLQGTLQGATADLIFTHVLVCDSSTEIRDGYTGRGTVTVANEDLMAIPAGQANNYYMAVFSFIAIMPDRGRQRIVLLDRAETPGDWTTVL